MSTADTANEYCREKAAASGSSFYYSFFFLDPPRRQAITALYAFCREVDDVVDDGGDADAARARLAAWRREVAAMYAGQPGHPVTIALARACTRFNLPPELLGEIIDGMEMDLAHQGYADFKALQLYCYRVASVVGLLAAEIFGHNDRRTLKYAHDLGLAFQLTNIIRDVGEDARRGRIYLPADEMARFGVDAADLAMARYSEAFRRLMEFQTERAMQYYDRALAQLPAADRRPQRPGLVMAAIYRALVEAIRRNGFRVLDHRTTLSAPRKLWIAGRTWMKG